MFRVEQAPLLIPGIIGNQTHNDSTYVSVGSLILDLGTISGGMSSVGRSLIFECDMLCTNATSAYKIWLYSLTTSLDVGAEITGADLTNTIITQDITGEVGGSLTEDARNHLIVRIGQQVADANELVVCDMARIRVIYG